jgi:alkyl sulfatase BDS1-like metallo-beta-lactamase superfamily hydrolase
VECFDGVESLCNKAETFLNRGDYRFGTTLLAHAIAAEPENPSIRAADLLATAYEHLGFGAENATWRNFYLTAAQELRTGKKAGMVAGGRTPLGEKLSVKQCFEILSVQLDSRQALDLSLCIDFNVVDIAEQWRLILNNGVLTRRRLGSEPYLKEARENGADLQMDLTKHQLLEIMRGNHVSVTREIGKREVLDQLVNLILVEENSARGPSQI